MKNYLNDVNKVNEFFSQLFNKYKLYTQNSYLSLIDHDTKRLSKKFVHGNILEFWWTVIPTLILFIIAVPSVKLLYLMDIPAISGSPICTIKVIGHQWFWSYEYPVIKDNKLDFIEFDSYMLDENTVFDLGGLRLLEVDNPLFVPINTTLRFLVTAVDVLHSWAIPSLGVKVDAIPGRLSQVYVTIKRCGEFYGQCSEICGVNHGFMPIKVVGLDFREELK